jgi:hypothetical protein
VQFPIKKYFYPVKLKINNLKFLMSGFPDLTLKCSKGLNNENKNENNNNISQTQTVIINKGELFPITKEEEQLSKTKDVVEKIRTPENITLFKETFLEILINYFGMNMCCCKTLLSFQRRLS